MEVLDKINNPLDIKKLNTRELEILASEIRTFLLNNVSKTGGHLSSNLGIVELTIALLYNYDFTKDKIIFDVGHQSYVYKILTGRKKEFNTLRQFNGLSGFPKRCESIYDFYDTGHSANSISAALGMARARDLKNENYHIISLIGDGAFTGGMVYEALNDLGYKKSKMLIILNDNQMSISQNVGGLSNYLNQVKLSSSYNKLKSSVHAQNNKISHSLHHLKNSFKSLFFNPMFFENLGIRYIGPIDGHDITSLIKTLNKVKNLDGPVVLHVITKKGLGYTPAMDNPDKFHAIGKFDIVTGNSLGNHTKTYSDAFGEALINIAKRNPSVVAISAAMINGTGLKEFNKLFPDRCFDVGITEEHAVSLASGMAINGLKPVVAIYSTFLQRAFDQILIDSCMQNLPVVFAIDRAGLVGSDGKTHQGVFDISYLSLMPNLEIIAPKCLEELPILLEYALKENNPVAIRYPRGGVNIPLKPLKHITKGKWEELINGTNLVVIATGKMVEIAYNAIKDMKNKPTLVNATFIKPLDINYLKKIVKNNLNVITLEDNNISGGFGSHVLLELSKLGFSNKIKIIAYPDQFINHGTVEELLEYLHMDSNSILKEIKKFNK